MDPKANNVWVEELGSTINHGGAALGMVPSFLKRVLREEAWRCFQPRMGPLVEHQRFVDFVTAPPLGGLGASVDLIRNLVRDDPEAVDLLDQALQNEPSLHVGNNVPGRPEGNTSAKALRKLRKDAPDLHADVIAGRLKAHAAMVQAGFRPRTATVRLDRPDAIARTLRKHLTDDQIAALMAELAKGPNT